MHSRRRPGEQERKRDAKLLAGGKHIHGPQPRRRRREADRAQKLHDVLDRHAAREKIEHALVRFPAHPLLERKGETRGE
jgi:hypothetical protein